MTIYKLQNKINGMIYIGQTTKVNPLNRINSHFKNSNYNQFYLQSAIKKYGKDNFSVEILATVDNLDTLNQLEIEYIKSFNCLAPNGYNLKAGGKQGGACSELVKQKISQIKKGKSNKKLLGRKFSKEHCLALSRVRKGKPQTPARTKAIKLAAISHQIPIQAINIKTHEIILFASIEICAKQLQLTPSCVSRVLRRDQNRTQHKGWDFKYMEKI